MLLKDEELLEATLDTIETFRQLASKSLKVQKSFRSQSTPFTDLQNEVRNQQPKYFIERSNRHFKKSQYGKEVLATIALDSFPYPQRQDIGNRSFSA